MATCSTGRHRGQTTNTVIVVTATTPICAPPSRSAWRKQPRSPPTHRPEPWRSCPWSEPTKRSTPWTGSPPGPISSGPPAPGRW